MHWTTRVVPRTITQPYPHSSLPPSLRQLTLGIKALDIYGNVMHQVLDTGEVVPSSISLCYTMESESPAELQ